MGIGNVTHHVGQQNAPTFALIETALLPKSNIQHGLQLLVRKPNANHLACGSRVRLGRNRQFTFHDSSPARRMTIKVDAIRSTDSEAHANESMPFGTAPPHFTPGPIRATTLSLDAGRRP